MRFFYQLSEDLDRVKLSDMNYEAQNGQIYCSKLFFVFISVVDKISSESCI